MPYTLTGFPFDLFLGIAIAFAFKPDLNIFICIFICLAVLISGFFIPSPYNIIFWAPGGAASMVISSFLIAYLFTNTTLFQKKSIVSIPDRKTLRSDLLKINTLEERQQEYIKLVVRTGNSLEKNNNAILGVNTVFFLSLFFSLFMINFSALTFIFIKTPEVIKNIFMEFYNSIIISPGNYDEWFKELLELAPFQIFVANVMFVLLNIFIIDKILSFRKIRQPAIGSPVFFKLPFFSLWIYIVLGIAFLVSIKLNLGPLYIMIAKNAFGIFSALYIFQGLSLVWLYLQVRLLPAGSLITILLLTSFILPVVSIFIFGILLIIGLLDFWIDLRKKALQPNLMSDGV